ncbi:U-box domain-containing protein 62 [Raphanus sativus]|uniref:U-box domain-containing protein 62 n=1 Tax=Raphanus sativus TaxID=3726 RepID=A0A6J0KGP4_RAPSA|nr:U-box domain-containing protein 62 [Raphanus sativus]KAJ4883457.1 U-box domain-containing protein 62 [Raphanus sativus]
MSGKGLSPASFTAPPMTIQDADPLRFRVGEQDPKTREFAAFIGDQHRYFAAAAAAAAASANPHPHNHLEFHQNFYSESGNPNDSGGSDGEEDVEEEEDEEDDDVGGNEGCDGGGMNKDVGEDSGAVTAVAQDNNNAAYYSQQFKTMEASFVSSSRHEESSSVAAENGCDVSGGRRDASSTSLSSSIESLRTILSDPITGALMSDAMILPCGHTFGAGGIEQVKQMKACCTCSQPVSEDSITPNLTLRVAVQAFCREEKSQSNHSSKRKREGGFDQERRTFCDSTYTNRSRNRTNHFPFAVADRVIIKGNKRTPPRFVGREAVVTTQCLNGWYVVKTLDNAESVKLQYRSLAKATEDPSAKATPSKLVSNWL